MRRIGILSDTHAYVNPGLKEFFKDVHEIWHAGDIGDECVLEEMEQWNKPLRVVWGNIDSSVLRRSFPQHDQFMCEDVNVWLTHIGGYPGKYAREVKEMMKQNPPNLFVCGHSHILKVIYDDKLNLLHINPGAAGRYGFHKVCTAVRLVIDGSNIKDLEVIELKR